MSEFVADASAILAYSCGEKGEAKVSANLARCWVSSLNLMEACSRLVRYGLDPGTVQAFLRESFPHISSVDRELAESAAILHATTRRLGISYGDCVCLTLGKFRQATVLTADRRWKDVEVDVKLEWIR